jgi:hypothetical protein
MTGRVFAYVFGSAISIASTGAQAKTIMVFLCGGGAAHPEQCKADAGKFQGGLPDLPVKLFFPTGNLVPGGNLLNDVEFRGFHTKGLPTRVYGERDFREQEQWLSEQDAGTHFIFIAASAGWVAFDKLAPKLKRLGVADRGYDVILNQPAGTHAGRPGTHRDMPFSFDDLPSRPRSVINLLAPDKQTSEVFDEPRITFSSDLYYAVRLGPVWSKDWEHDGPEYLPTKPMDKHGTATGVGLEFVVPVVRLTSNSSRDFATSFRQANAEISFGVETLRKMAVYISALNPKNLDKWPGKSKYLVDYLPALPTFWSETDDPSQGESRAEAAEFIARARGAHRAIVFGMGPAADTIYREAVATFGQENVERSPIVASAHYMQYAARNFRADAIFVVTKRRALDVDIALACDPKDGPCLPRRGCGDDADKCPPLGKYWFTWPPRHNFPPTTAHGNDAGGGPPPPGERTNVRGDSPPSAGGSGPSVEVKKGQAVGGAEIDPTPRREEQSIPAAGASILRSRKSGAATWSFPSPPNGAP